MGVDILKKYRETLKVFGYLLSTYPLFVMWITFLVAYNNGGKISITINSMGEANLEFILIMILFPVIMLGLFLTLKDFFIKLKTRC